ncbi:MAG: ribonuclease R [Bacteroidales bacterium]|nr:ribonuclease R [Bacteroidales bacterium]MBN2755918.1 ribonuclease R [Bacteroidales bacterium]
MGHKKKDKKKNLPSYNRITLKKFILDIFRNNPTMLYNYKQISKILDITDNETKKLITRVFYDLVESGNVEELYTGKFKFISSGSYITGIVDMTRRGTAYIISDEISEDVFISQNNLIHALHGDEVKVSLYARRKKHNLEGEVVEILNHAKTTFVGIVDLSKNFAFLIVESKNMPYDIFIPITKLNGAKNGEKAIAKITEWPKNAKNPFGEIVEVLGKPGNNDVEMHAILAEFELPFKFPEFINSEAEKIEDKISDEEIKKRRDFRDIITFTIDPKDAKDFDDALSITKLENDNYEIGVHIADVSHYVTPNSIIDEEAFQRGTSVYLVDRVVPMLPEKLSNLVCSLRPDEEKLCFSTVIEMDENANVIKYWIGKTIIKSDKRFTYEEAQEIIENKNGELASEILKLDELAKKLRAKRYIKGSISFDKIEIKFEVDEEGKPIDVYFKESKDSNKLIEEFMLLANKKVAEEIGNEKPKKEAKTFVYRIHDEPDLEKLNNFSSFIKRYGYNISLKSNKEIASSLNDLLTEVKGKAEQNVIENLAIRSMAKAEYSTNNIGHYGLAFDFYSHFTSPIRRYPDLMVHRLLESYLIKKEKSANKSEYEKMCKHSSDMERRAAMAERASIKYKQVEFMQDKIGQVFEGVISSVTEWGMYVELKKTRIEGMVALKDMDDDFYEFNEKSFSIIGKVKKKKYQLGDDVKVQIIRTNLQRKQLDMLLVEEKSL